MADLKEAVGTVLEGWTLPHDVRKILETAYYADTPAPVQADHSEQVLDMVKAEHSLEVLGDSYSFLPPAPDSPSLPHRRVWVQGVNVTDHAKATAALAQKEAAIERLTEELEHWEGRSCRGDCIASPCRNCDGTRHIPGEGQRLKEKLAEAEKDARNWRQYQARKQAVIDAGMGKNPLRDATLRAQLSGVDGLAKSMHQELLHLKGGIDSIAVDRASLRMAVDRILATYEAAQGEKGVAL